MTIATLIKKTFNWSKQLPVSVDQSIIIMEGEHGGIQSDVVLGLRVGVLEATQN